MTDAPPNNSPIVAPRDTRPRSGLLVLRNTTAAYFVDNDIPATVAEVGLRFRNFQLNTHAPGGANRVVFIPGEYDGDDKKIVRKFGKLSSESRNSASPFNPRELASWEQPFTVSVWAAPLPGRATYEGESVGEAESLVELVIRASRGFTSSDGSNAAASLHWGEIVLNTPADRPFGAELLVKCVRIVPIFDIAYEYVQPKLVTTTKRS